jgi:hypothetical protein
MDSFGEVIQTYSRPRTIWRCNIARSGNRTAFASLGAHAETVVAIGYSPERTQILALSRFAGFCRFGACGTIVND